MADPRLILHQIDGTSVSIQPNEDREGTLNFRRKHFPEGTRVRLTGLVQNVNGYDDRPNLPPGSIGTVIGDPDDAGSLPIRWDHGATLAATINDRIETWTGQEPPVYGDQTTEGEHDAAHLRRAERPAP